MADWLDEASLLRSVETLIGVVAVRLELPSLRVLSIGEGIQTVTSIPRAAWLRRDFWSLHLHSEDWPAMRIGLARARVGSTFQTRLRVAVGGRTYLPLRLVCAREGNTASIQGFLVLESPLEQVRDTAFYRDRLATVEETDAIFVTEFDIPHRVERADQRLYALLGYDAGELLTRDEWMEIVVAEDRERVENHEAAALALGTPNSVARVSAIDYRVRRRDGQTLWLRRETRVWRGRRGIPERVVSAIRNVDALVTAESGRTTAATLVDAVLATFPGSAAILDANGIIVAANDAWQRAAADEWDGEGERESPGLKVPVHADFLRMLRERVAAGDAVVEPLLAALERVLAGTAAHVAIENSSWPAPGATRRLTFVARRLERAGGALVMCAPSFGGSGAVEIGELGASADRVSQLAITGGLFAAITHDLRQPLTALRMNLAAALELAQRDLPGALRVAEILTEALGQQDRMQHTLAMMQDLVSRRAPARDAVDLSELAREVIRIVETEAIARRAPLVARLASDLPRVRGDRRLIREALLGLVLDALGVLGGADGDVAPTRVLVTTRRANAHVEVAVCRFADAPAVNSEWALAIARAVAEVHEAPLVLDADGAAGACVRLRWPAATEETTETDPARAPER